MPLCNPNAASLKFLVSIVSCWLHFGGVAKRILRVPHVPWRVVPEKRCMLDDQWLVVNYKDGENMSEAGTFVYGTTAAWNGLLLVTKTYGNEQCLVSYRAACEGSHAFLLLDDTCDSRTTKRKFFTSNRRTELHKNTLFRRADDRIQVFLAGGGELDMVADGSEVTFTIVDPNEKTGKLHGVPTFRYLINGPRLNVCSPPPSAPDSVFVSKSTGYAYSTKTCSSCRLFFASTLQHFSQATQPWSSTPEESCAHGETPRSKMACQNFVRKLKSENSSIISKVIDSFGPGHGRDAEIASAMTCQDIGCCPLDAELAINFDEIVRKEAAVERELWHHANLKLATTVLENPMTRQRLELVLTNKVFNLKSRGSHVDHLEKQKPLPTTDDMCKWNYRAARCSHLGVCSYQYKFLDTTFDESCRLKIRPTRPVTDADCLWDAKRVACAEPDLCKRFCKFGDSLNQCCKLREPPKSAQSNLEMSPGHDDVSEKSEPEGICANPGDRQILSSPTLPDVLENIGKKCFSLLSFNINSAKSLKMHEELGLSSQCSVCFVDSSKCSLDQCFGVLSTKGKEHPDSQACINTHCEPALLACSGLPPDERRR